MKDLEFSFGQEPWEAELNTIADGGQLSAARFLTVMEDASDADVEDALNLLEKRDILLDVSDLPRPAGQGEMALRLRTEEQLVKKGTLLKDLEEQDPLGLYLRELAAIPVCGDPVLLAQQCLEGDQDAPGRLANLLLSRVVEISLQLTGKGVLLLDLIQEGSLGLWQAILAYPGGDVESYCDRCVRRVMGAFIVRQARENGVGQRLRQAMEDYRAVDERLLSDLGRNPTLEEIAQQLHMTAEEAAVVAGTLESARTMHKARNQEPEETPEEEDQAVEDTAYFQMRQRISELMSVLDEKDAKLLTLRFGLEGGLPLNPTETGRKLGLTPEEVVAREAAALQKLRGQG